LFVLNPVNGAIDPAEDYYERGDGNPTYNFPDFFDTLDRLPTTEYYDVSRDGEIVAGGLGVDRAPRAFRLDITRETGVKFPKKLRRDRALWKVSADAGMKRESRKQERRAKMASGIAFNEVMAGGFSLGESDPEAGVRRGAAEGHILTLSAEIVIDDLDAFLADPDHAGRLSGRVDFPALGDSARGEAGTFNLFSPSDDPKMKLMVYELGFRVGGKDYYLAGRKRVKDDPGFDLWSDTTTLYTTLHEGTDAAAPIVGAGVLRLGLGELKDMVSTIRATGTTSPDQDLAVIARFGVFFLGRLWKIYGGLADPFEVKNMVHWFDPRQLVRTALRAVLAAIFSEYADKREALAAHAGADEREFHNYSAGDPEGGIWLDYVADLGDGFDSTYAVAYLLAQERLTPADGEETRRGDILIMGGDEVYPTPGRESYRDRLIGPYSAALPWLSPTNGGDPPHIFAIPGNHDWYDGLTSFTRVFCQRRGDGGGRWIGAWRTQQFRSYFALKLPGNWWLFAIDIQLSGYIDQPQLDYFRRVADKYLRPREVAGQTLPPRIILCTAEPSWVYTKTKHKDAYRNLGYMEKVIEEVGGELGIVTLTGDLHHYSRYRRPPTGAEPVARNMITAGGGGAYLSPTHALPLHVDLDASQHPGRYELQTEHVYPEQGCSKRLAWGNLLFPFYNPTFLLTLGGLYFFFAWLLESAAKGLDRSLLDELGNALMTWPGFAAVVDGLWSVFRNSPASMILLLAIYVGLIKFCQVRPAARKWALGVVHASAHLLLILVLMAVLSYLNLSIGATAALPDFWLVVLFIVEMVVIGGFLGAFLMGIYLLVSLNLFEGHWTEAFSSMRIVDYKNFLRLHVEGDGTLTIYAVGIDRVPRRRQWRDRGTGQSQGARFVPEPGSALSYRQIDKITIGPTGGG
jgi:hypothetical protein